MILTYNMTMQPCIAAGLALLVAVGCGPSSRRQAADADVAKQRAPRTERSNSEAVESGPSESAEQKPSDDTSFAREWAWVQERFPATKGLIPASDRKLLDALLGWVPPGGEATLYDADCEPIRVTRREVNANDPATNQPEDMLLGKKDERVEFFYELRYVSHTPVTIGWEIYEYCTSTESYEQAPNGQWTHRSSRGTGCSELAGRGLSRVTESAVWYSGHNVVLTVGCTGQVRETMTCTNGEERICEACNRWGLIQRYAGPGNGGSSFLPATRRLDGAIDCSHPCVPPEPAPSLTLDLERAERAVHDRLFRRSMWSELDKPSLFRTRTACMEYQK